jgi:hypothetical protein
MHSWLRFPVALAAVAALFGQQAPELQILVIGGEGSINNVKQRTAREPVVEIRDRNNRPVARRRALRSAEKRGFGGSSAVRQRCA